MRTRRLEIEMRVLPHGAQREGLSLEAGDLDPRRLLLVAGRIERDAGLPVIDPNLRESAGALGAANVQARRRLLRQFEPEGVVFAESREACGAKGADNSFGDACVER